MGVGGFWCACAYRVGAYRAAVALPARAYRYELTTLWPNAPSEPLLRFTATVSSQYKRQSRFTKKRSTLYHTHLSTSKSSRHNTEKMVSLQPFSIPSRFWFGTGPSRGSLILGWKSDNYCRSFLVHDAEKPAAADEKCAEVESSQVTTSYVS
jgi:hypothetical protein